MKKETIILSSLLLNTLAFVAPGSFLAKMFVYGLSVILLYQFLELKKD